MAETRIVKPRPISGFPEWLPEQKIVENRLLAIIREEFERHGFAQIETPAVENRDILSAKGVIDKEIYGLSRLAAAEGEDPSTDLALHFDLTVPLARYVAQHFGSLTFPFRRYQMQKVWRGERPQAGRFREFYQCDIDIIGNGSLSTLNDAEIPCVIHAIFSRAGIGDFVIRMNNRKVLQGFIRSLGLDDAALPEALRIIDELEKIGAEAVARLLAERTGLAAASVDRLMGFVTGAPDPASLGALCNDPLFQEGAQDVEALFSALADLGLPESAYVFDPSIARGLDYYTGTVYETRLATLPDIGSICSGGRYDNLASTFTRQKLPGVGISIGLTRMLARLLDAGILTTGSQTPAPVLVTVMSREHLSASLGLAATLRGAGIATELFTEPKKIGDQLKYAAKKGFAVAVIAGETELAEGNVQVKALATGDQMTVPRAELVDLVSRIVAGNG